MCLGCALLKNYIVRKNDNTGFAAGLRPCTCFDTQPIGPSGACSVSRCTQLSELCFYNCSDITVLREIPHTLSKLSFYNCPNLTEIPKIPDTVQVYVEKCPHINILF